MAYLTKKNWIDKKNWQSNLMFSFLVVWLLVGVSSSPCTHTVFQQACLEENLRRKSSSSGVSIPAFPPDFILHVGKKGSLLIGWKVFIKVDLTAHIYLSSDWFFTVPNYEGYMLYWNLREGYLLIVCMGLLSVDVSHSKKEKKKKKEKKTEIKKFNRIFLWTLFFDKELLLKLKF